MKFHLIGIGGAGMNVVAQMLARQGHDVVGSDKMDSPIIEQLRSQGITVYIGHDSTQVDPEATVVVSTAIRSDNAEMVVAVERDQPIMHRSQALAFAARDQKFVAVAGAHGKTTTSGMLATILAYADRDPSFAIGSIVAGFDSGARVGAGDICVAEADESDGSFLNYAPTHAIITNIEPDHLDHYQTTAAFEAAFEAFSSSVADTVIACADDAGCRRLLEKLPAKTIGYGINEGEIRAAITRVEDGSCLVTYQWGQCSENLRLQVIGEHNVLNGLAAWAMAVQLGVKPDVAARGLEQFSGTARRFQERGMIDGVRVIDDYAHHPSEVAAAIKQAHIAAGSGRVIVIFQPHLYSRTRNFAARFASALATADKAFVTDIYAAREDIDTQVTAQTITAHGGCEAIPDLFTAADAAVNLARSGDIIMTMGAGDVTKLGGYIIAALASRRGSVDE